MTSRAAKIPPERIAQASAWVSTLHGDNRTAQTEQALQRWLGEDPLNAQAFEQITELWEVTRSLPRRRIVIPDRLTSRSRLLRPLGIAASFVLVSAVGALAYYLLHDPSISTDTGEQRIVALEDGTQITLNTHTELTYRFDDSQRHIELKRGEALFEIAKDPVRPFTVSVDDKIITALGTRFAVRKDAHRTAVTLIDGKVSVSERILTPGQRITFDSSGSGKVQVDTPQLDNVLAWKRREVFLNETPLRDAVAEMNRYSKKVLIVSGAGTDRIPVTGLFRAGDSLSFAHAVADTYGLKIRQTAGQIRLEPQ